MKPQHFLQAIGRAHCRKARYNEFKAAWIAANAEAPDNKLSVQQIDDVLHKERVTIGAQKVTYTTKLSDLPNGAFVELDGKPYLLWDKTLYLWSPEGYKKTDITAPAIDDVKVLTPASIVNMYSNGFAPEVHQSIANN